ncbi:hypothetical protein GCM10017764_15350 [Sphingobacterium griseoflavum]|uniref:Uncharacterized protein n=1 Tax=Sphingobacterium griseoflavum TaxID=1474952 RepID=A0ABQ3HYL8_9SPHI|nr:hypothetical protein GCM10017764_15350 [Sphingobacterium griseoflavum]
MGILLYLNLIRFNTNRVRYDQEGSAIVVDIVFLIGESATEYVTTCRFLEIESYIINGQG